METGAVDFHRTLQSYIIIHIEILLLKKGYFRLNNKIDI